MRTTARWSVVLGMIQLFSSVAAADGPTTYEWVGECESIPMDWVCQDCANGNWSPAGQPGPLDTANIAGASVRARGCCKSVDVLNVMEGASLNINTDLSVQTLATTWDVVFGGGITFSPTVSTTGAFHLAGPGSVWERAILTGTANFIVDAGGSLRINPATTEKRLDGTTLVNAGTVNAFSSFNLANEAVILNLGTWRNWAGNTGGTVESGQQGRFDNLGTLSAEYSGSLVTRFTAIPVDQIAGTIRVDRVTLNIASGGEHSGGQYELVQGGTLVLTGFDSIGPDGVHITGDVTAHGAGNLKLEQDTTFIEAGGSLATSLALIDGNDGVVGLWIENCAVVQCDGPLVNTGAMRWSRGTLRGAAGVTNQTAGTLLIDDVGGSGCGNARLETTLTSFGVAEQRNDLRFGTDGVLIAGGTYAFISGSILDEGDDTLFRNALLLRREGFLPTSQSWIYVPYQQTISGNIAVERGILGIGGGGTVAGGVWSIMADGEVRVSGPALRFGPIGGTPRGSGAHALGDGVFRVTGSGTILQVDEDFTVDMAPSADDQEFQFEAGTIAGGGRLVNRGEMNWIGGTIGLSDGNVVHGHVANENFVRVPNSGVRTLRGTLTNEEGALIFAGLLTIDGGTLVNHGELNLSLGGLASANAGRIENNGVIVKNFDSTYTIAALLDPSGGRVTVNDGNLVLAGGVTGLRDGTLSRGRWEIASGATLTFPGATIVSTTVDADVVLEGGASFPAIQSLIDNGGSLEVRGPSSVPFLNLNANDGTISTTGGGVIQTKGTVTNDEAGVLEQYTVISGPQEVGSFDFPLLINEGTIRPGGPDAAGPFVLNGNLEQGASAVIEIDLAGETAISTHDHMLVAGHASLAGTLHVRVLPGYEPAGGETFTIFETADGGTISGTFDSITGAGAYQASYGAGSVVLTLVTPPVAGDVSGDGVVNFSDLLLVLAAWGACPGDAPCPADVDGNGAVDFNDLIVVLSFWT